MSRTATGFALLLFLNESGRHEKLLWPPVATCGYWEGGAGAVGGVLCPPTSPSKTEGARPTEKEGGFKQLV